MIKQNAATLALPVADLRSSHFSQKPLPHHQSFDHSYLSETVTFSFKKEEQTLKELLEFLLSLNVMFFLKGQR